MEISNQTEAKEGEKSFAEKSFPFSDFNKNNVCNFCSLRFGSPIERNAHILEHFVQMNCFGCNKNLVQIGDNWYELHSEFGCKTTKEEPEQLCSFEESFVGTNESEGLHFDTVEIKREEWVFAGVKNHRKNSHIDFSHESVPVPDTSDQKNTNMESLRNRSENVTPKVKNEKFRLEKCTFPGCSKMVSNRAMADHMSKHTGNMAYECHLCRKKYPYSSSLNNHLKSHEQQKFSCSFCKRRFDSNESKQQHVLTVHNNEELLPCNFCQKTFLTRNSLRNHKALVHAEKSYRCTLPGCDKSFALKKKLNEHLNVHNGISQYACEVCGKGYPYASSLQKHRQSHKIARVKCDICQLTFPPDYDLMRHITVHNFDTFSCDICKASFGQLYALKTHMKLHVGLPYKCTLCEKSFRYQKRLDEHMDTHNGIKKYICEVCGKFFSQKSSLIPHKLIHENTKVDDRVECTFENCKKLIKRKGLQAHMLQHDPNAKQFPCHCGKSYVTKFKLKAHQVIHDEVKRFQCNFCQASFRTKTYLMTHENIHTGAKVYECTTCKKSFLQSSTLRAHQRVHTGEKPCKCDIEGCDKAYMYDIDLKRHKFSTHGIYHKKYPCSICSRVFPENKLLKRHLESHV